MAVTFSSFKTKFAPAFDELLEAQFALFLADALVEVNQLKWEPFGVNAQNFKDRATENYIACQLSKLNREYLGASGIQAFEVREAGYKIQYNSPASATAKEGESRNPYCSEYDRLLAQLGSLTPDTSRLPIGSTCLVKNVYWG